MKIDAEKFFATAALIAATTTGLTGCPAKPEAAADDAKGEDAKADDAQADAADDAQVEPETDQTEPALPGDESGGEPPPAEDPVDPEADDGADDASNDAPAATKETLY